MFSVSVAAGIAGVFVLPGLAVEIAGPWASLSFLLAGLMVLPAVLAKAELATAMPVAGGSFVYIDRAMGPWVGTIEGIGTWTSLCSKTAYSLVGIGAYLSLFGDPALFKPISLAFLVGLVTLNVLGVGKASKFQTAAVVICLSVLTFFGVWGAAGVNPDHYQPAFPSGWVGIATGAAFVFTAYAGVTKACSVAEEVHRPERNIPYGMLAAHFTIMALFAGVTWVTVGLVSPEELRGSAVPLALAAEVLGGKPLLAIISVVAVLGLLAMSNAGVLAGSRYPFAMGRAQILPPWTQGLSPRFATPVPSILLTGVFLFCLVLFLPLYELAKLASVFKINMFTMINVTVILLRVSGAGWYRPTFRAPLYPWLQIAAIAGGVAMLVALGMFAVVGLLGAVTVGSVWYLAYVRPRVDRKSALVHLWGEARALRETARAEATDQRDGLPPRVVAPLFGGEDDPTRTIRAAARFVGDGWLEVLRFHELPEQTMLAASLPESEETRLFADAACAAGEEMGVHVVFRDILTHNAKRSVAEHAARTRAEWIVMDWPEQAPRRALVRNPTAWWQDHTPRDLALVRDRGEPSWRRILVLAKAGPYDSLVVHVADRLARRSGGCLTLFRPVSPLTTLGQIKGHRAYHQQLAELCQARTESLILRTDDQERTVAEISADYDLLLMGAAPERSFRTLFFGSAEHRVAEAATCSVIKVKSPADRVHARFRMPTTSQFGAPAPLALTSWTTASLRLDAARKDDVIPLVGARIAESLGVDMADAITAKLRKRERQQPTQRPGGVAMIGATKYGLPATCLGVFTLARPIAWGVRTRRKVDVVLAVMSPPGERQHQLWLLARLARMLQLDGVPEALRDARDEEELLDVVGEADQRIRQLEAHAS